MIPDFDSYGNLPSGVHEVTMEEFEIRFVYNPRRKYLYKGLKRLMSDLNIKVGCKSIYIDGSFVTDKLLPGDIDVCWTDLGIDYDFAFARMPILDKTDPPRKEQHELYHCDILPAYCFESESKNYFVTYFQYDTETNRQKGIIKIKI